MLLRPHLLESTSVSRAMSYPDTVSTWPHSREVVERDFKGVLSSTKSHVAWLRVPSLPGSAWHAADHHDVPTAHGSALEYMPASHNRAGLYRCPSLTGQNYCVGRRLREQLT